MLIASVTAADWLAVGITTAATLMDLRQGKISNKLTYPAAVAGVVLTLLPRSALTFTQSLVGLAFSFAVYYVLHRVAGFGAGDVKLMAALGAIKGATFVVVSSFYILCIGAALGLVLLAWRNRLIPSLKWVFGTIIACVLPGFKRPLLGEDATSMPFAPAIFLGVVLGVYVEASQGPFQLALWV
jgi:prepilin peptidase CpaA